MQKKIQSPILRAGLIALIMFLSKKYWNYELENEFVCIAVDVLLGVIIAIAVVNNPDRSDRF